MKRTKRPKRSERATLRPHSHRRFWLQDEPSTWVLVPNDSQDPWQDAAAILFDVLSLKPSATLEITDGLRARELRFVCRSPEGVPQCVHREVPRLVPIPPPPLCRHCEHPADIVRSFQTGDAKCCRDTCILCAGRDCRFDPVELAWWARSVKDALKGSDPEALMMFEPCLGPAFRPSTEVLRRHGVSVEVAPRFELN